MMDGGGSGAYSKVGADGCRGWWQFQWLLLKGAPFLPTMVVLTKCFGFLIFESCAGCIWDCPIKGRGEILVAGVVSFLKALPWPFVCVPLRASGETLGLVHQIRRRRRLIVVSFMKAEFWLLVASLVLELKMVKTKRGFQLLLRAWASEAQCTTSLVPHPWLLPPAHSNPASHLTTPLGA